MLIEKLLESIKGLTEEEKIIIFHYYINGKSQTECSRILNIPQRTISSKLKRIYKKLKKYIES